MRIIEHLFLPASTGPARRHRLLAAGLLALVAVATVHAAPRYDFNDRAATVDALVVAGERLGGGPATVRMFGIVEQLLGEARSAWQAGDEARAYGRLDDAYALIRVVVRGLATARDAAPRVTQAVLPDSGATATGARRYVQLQESVAALLVAYRAIRDERHGDVADIEPEVSTLLARAWQQHAAGLGEQALLDVQEAYALLQAEVVRLRGGQTLVHEQRAEGARAE